VEFAIILPLLLLLTLGIIEVGHWLAVYSSASSAANQAARYGAVAGLNADGTAFYLDCTGIRASAKRTAFLQGLSDSDIQVMYDTGLVTSTIGACDSNNVPRFTTDGTAMTNVNSDELVNGGRIVVTVTTIYNPIVPIVPIPPLPLTFVSARTIFTAIDGPTPVPPSLPDLSISKTGTPSLVAPGGLITYTLTISNSGPGVATSIRVTDTLPTGTAFVSVAGSGWTCAQVSGTVVCSLAVLSPGAASPITIRATAPLTSGTLVNTASVASSGADPVTTNNSASVTTTVISAADLAITLTDTPDPTSPGSTVTYTLNVVNNGSITANLVAVTDTLPAGTTFLSASGTGWLCSLSSGIVICTRPTLAVGSAPAIVLRLTAPNISTTLTNSASVGSATVDPIPANNSATTTTTLVSDADLSLAITDTPDPAGMNDNVTYALQVTNLGPSPATTVTLTNTLPAAATFVSASGSGWTCNQAGGTVTCTMGSLAVGGAPQVNITVKAPASSTTLTDSASVSSAISDPNLVDNSATATTTVLACNPGQVSAAYSQVAAMPPQVQADGQQTSDVVVTVKDNCGSLLANHTVVLSSSRGAADTIAPASATTNATGQVIFQVKSATTSPYVSGAFTPSTFTATVDATTAVSQTDGVAFVCVTGVLAPFNGSQDLQFSFTNNTGLNRRLISLTLTWPSTGSRQVTSITFGPDQIWSGNGNNSAFTVNGGWTAGDRSLNATLSKTLKLNFNYVLSGTGQYNLSTQWDNTANGSICTAPTITVTR